MNTTINTYDIVFNDDSNSNNKGFNCSKEEAIQRAEDMLKSKESYVNDYQGGTISVVCNQTGETAWERDIL